MKKQFIALIASVIMSISFGTHAITLDKTYKLNRHQEFTNQIRAVAEYLLKDEQTKAEVKKLANSYIYLIDIDTIYVYPGWDTEEPTQYAQSQKEADIESDHEYALQFAELFTKEGVNVNTIWHKTHNCAVESYPNKPREWK